MTNLVLPKNPAVEQNGQTPAVQDYLRAIYLLARRAPDGGRVTTSQLAERLGVRPASVTAMLQKMAVAPALVDYHKSHGVRLTTDGERAALHVVRCHRLLELFLHEKLGFGWDEVHEEADRLEHAVSGALADRLAEALGHPTRDPHGHAIPAADLSVNRPMTMPLSQLTVGQMAQVQSVPDEDPVLLRHLDLIGLRPGASVQVIGRVTRRDGAIDLQICIGDEARTLNDSAADWVFVAPVPELAALPEAA
jgi:DtxR family Mn-dependent transcriptional regulator